MLDIQICTHHFSKVMPCAERRAVSLYDHHTDILILCDSVKFMEHVAH
jgi:hypothetical protein